jgi:hypothetical protein
MSNTKHTPGPWTVKHSESKTAFNVIGAALGGKYKIARCPYLSTNGMYPETDRRDKAEAEANAQLIAGSPTLLSEMKRYLPVFELLEKNEPEMWDFLTQGTGIATLNGYRNAIAKAEGKEVKND